MISGCPGSSVTSVLASPVQHHNDKAEYRAPTAMWGMIHVSVSEYIKDCIEALAWDLSGMGLSVWWKEHQLAESRSQIMLVCMPLVYGHDGFHEEVMFQLKEAEKRLIFHKKLPQELADVPLPKIVVTWH